MIDLKLFLLTLIPMTIIDALWLYTAGRSIYPQYIQHLMGEKLVWLPIIIFYILYAVGVVVFVVSPALSGGYSIAKTAFMGLLLGLVAYGAYDLTNHATLKDWAWQMTLIDMCWGAVVTGVSAGIATLLARI